MADMPETITLAPLHDSTYVEYSTVGRFVNGAVYRRADLPPTDAQLMADPKVAALVEALKTMRDDRTGYRHAAHFRRRISVILAAFPAQGGET
jgi:hypothetical protein